MSDFSTNIFAKSTDKADVGLSMRKDMQSFTAPESKQQPKKQAFTSKQEEEAYVRNLMARDKPKVKRSALPSIKAPKEVKEPTDREAEDKEKENTILLIQRYCNNPRFKDHLESLGFKMTPAKFAKLRAKPIAESQEVLVKIRQLVGHKNTSSNLGGDLIKMGLMTTEDWARHFGFNIDGMTDELWADEEFLDLLEQLKLEYLSFGEIRDPRLKFAWMVSKTAYKCYLVNLAKVQAQPVAQPEPQPQPQPEPETEQKPKRGRPKVKRPSAQEEY